MLKDILILTIEAFLNFILINKFRKYLIEKLNLFFISHQTFVRIYKDIDKMVSYFILISLFYNFISLIYSFYSIFNTVDLNYYYFSFIIALLACIKNSINFLYFFYFDKSFRQILN